jgi:CDP-glucose 4,6-dehydratase
MDVREFYRGRRVLITGHTGFKGSWLAMWLRDVGAEVTGYALPPDDGRPALFELADVGRDIRSVFGDVRDRTGLEKVLQTARPELVFHLAAQSLVRRSYADPIATFETNVLGTAHLLDALRCVNDVRAVVVVTSDKCYENVGLNRGYREDDPLGGHDPYSASKGCQEIVTASFRRAFLEARDVAVASARAGNVVGGGDWSEDRLVADLMLAAARDREAVIRSPDSVRPWQHVLEPLRGYLMLGRALHDEGGAWAEAWNFGPDAGDALTVRELVERMTRAWPRLRTRIARQTDAPHEAHVLRVDNAKARLRLGWEPALTLDATVAMTVDWYREVAENPTSAATMVRQQIHDYEARVRAAGQIA